MEHGPPPLPTPDPTPAATPASLVALYLKAIYRARENTGNAWHIMRFEPGSLGATDDPSRLPFRPPWLIITAWNPMSVPKSFEENVAAQARLIEAVNALGLPFHPAEGVDESTPPSWREESILVEGIEWKPALQLVRVFRQGAGVYCAGGRAGLLFAEPERWDVYPLRILGASSI